MQMTTQWIILSQPEQVAVQAAQQVIEWANQCIAQQGYFRIVLAGGTTPKQTYQHLRSGITNWKSWFIYYGDERVLPIEDSQRNHHLAETVWLNQVPIPKTQIHPIPTELGVIEAADYYEEVIKKAMPFDVVILGMGEDGHVASIFPSIEVPSDRWVYSVLTAPKPPPCRVTLSPIALANTQHLLLLITGETKRLAVQQWRSHFNLPVVQLAEMSPMQVFIDQAAWGEGK